MSGKLYICGTPIGNLEDASIRLLKVLRQVDLIACEDTRHTRKLLTHFKIHNQLVSYHQHSHHRKEKFLLETLLEGKNIALVTDAGMPTISDPGEDLVRQAIEAGIEVDVIPGPSAFTAALAISGLDSSSFIFAGFLPPRSMRRREALSGLTQSGRTVVIYEAPHRLLDTLEDMSIILGESAPLVVVRELTKLYQEVRRGSVGELISYYQQNPARGEICLLWPVISQPAPSLEQIVAETEALIESGIEKKEAFKMKAREYKIKKSTIYEQFLDNKE